MVVEKESSANGVLEVYVDNTQLTLGGSWTKIDIAGEKARLRIVWRPSDKAEDSSVKVWLEAYRVDKEVDTCMAVKDCLDKFGDTSDEAFKLRNANEEQFKCLTGQTSDMSTAMHAKCEEWDNCLVTSGKKPILRALVSAAIKKSSLLEGVAFANQSSDAASCVNPEVDDAESWDCECAQEIAEKCNEADGDVETCIKALLCKDPIVCGSWKAEHCGGLPTASMEQRRLGSSKAATMEQLDNGLDGAVQGKCSQ